MGQLENKIVLITGAGSGIGRASALACAHDGAIVIVSDVSEEGGAGTVDLVRASGGKAQFIRTDATEADEVERLVAETVRIHGRLDCAHNNAGITGRDRPSSPVSTRKRHGTRWSQSTSRASGCA